MLPYYSRFMAIASTVSIPRRTTKESDGPPSLRNVKRMSFRMPSHEAKIFEAYIRLRGQTMQDVMCQLARRYCGLEKR